MKKNSILNLTKSVWDYSPGETESHMSFINLENFLVMVDTGMDPQKTKILREFAEEKTGKKFRYLIITHHHGDHTFGTKIFKDCDIISSKSTMEILSEKIQGVYKDKEIVLPNITFEGKYKIKDGSREIIIRETNGHTRGSSFVYLPEESVIITGDILFANMFPFAGDPSVDPYQWIEAFQKIIDLKPKIVIPGHGHISSISEVVKGQKLIENMLKYIEDKIEQNKTIDEIKNSNDLPEFTKDAYPEWVDKTIKVFYERIKEKRS